MTTAPVANLRTDNGETSPRPTSNPKLLFGLASTCIASERKSHSTIRQVAEEDVKFRGPPLGRPTGNTRGSSNDIRYLLTTTHAQRRHRRKVERSCPPFILSADSSSFS
ncbi:hypothetical protein CEXT_136741 [Caerostris extrusa]|uniref:Uncharacterized protein n=1 Tax=Caerostris extrusa TaxID=172846 RepID=A0AAV4NTI6_CAEEX|nr:hypothetical protein CEXT_136741 [Caerostris extrusa]